MKYIHLSHEHIIEAALLLEAMALITITEDGAMDITEAGRPVLTYLYPDESSNNYSHFRRLETDSQGKMTDSERAGCQLALLVAMKLQVIRKCEDDNE